VKPCLLGEIEETSTQRKIIGAQKTNMQEKLSEFHDRKALHQGEISASAERLNGEWDANNVTKKNETKRVKRGEYMEGPGKRLVGLDSKGFH